NTLIVLGVAILIACLLWPWLGKLPLGLLPVDIFVDRPGLILYLPITTMVLISVVVSVLVWLFRR
ncbi:MAG: DUF2905 family protein, partial [Pseudomonadota bacterium]